MARRGENIRKRKDGRWEGRYIKARTSEGKIQWGYVYGTVYAEVKRVLIQRKAEAGFYNLNRTDLTFEALAEVWLHSLRSSSDFISMYRRTPCLARLAYYWGWNWVCVLVKSAAYNGGDFDLKLGTLKISRTVCRISCGNGHTKVVIQTPKTRTSRREIPIPKYLLLMLKKLRKDASNAACFLSGSESKPTEPRCYRKSIKAYLKQAAVRQVRPHALRHTFATTCLQTGCDVKTLSELLGHANANITLQRYVHSDLTRKRREMNRIFSHQVSMRGKKSMNLME